MFVRFVKLGSHLKDFRNGILRGIFFIKLCQIKNGRKITGPLLEDVTKCLIIYGGVLLELIKHQTEVTEEMKTSVHFTAHIFPDIMQLTTYYKKYGKAS
jgi:hypothetical protein